MSDDGDGFISRWSRRKRAVREEDRQEASDARPAAVPESGIPAGVEGGPVDVADLPDVETLDENSDFSVFLKEGVPDALRRQALRRLWRLNPVFANLDGLNDYDEDYTNAATVIQGLRTAYRAGRGFVDEPAEDEETVEEPETAAGPDDLPAEQPVRSPDSPSASSPGEPSDEAVGIGTDSRSLADDSAEEDSTGKPGPSAPAVDDSPHEAALDRGPERAPATIEKKAPRRRAAQLRRWGDSSS